MKIKICSICGSEFIDKTKRGHQTYCSLACSYATRKERQKEKYHQKRKPLYSPKCPYCEETRMTLSQNNVFLNYDNWICFRCAWKQTIKRKKAGIKL